MPVKVEEASDAEFKLRGRVPHIANHTVKVEQVEQQALKEESSSNELLLVTAKPAVHKTTSSMKHHMGHQSVSSSSGSPSSHSSSCTSTSSHHAIYVDSDDDKPIWPHDFYCVNVINGFKACKRACRAKLNVGKTFEDIFRTQFKLTTFYDHCWLWNGAMDKVCTKCYGPNFWLMTDC